MGIVIELDELPDTNQMGIVIDLERPALGRWCNEQARSWSHLNYEHSN